MGSLKANWVRGLFVAVLLLLSVTVLETTAKADVSVFYKDTNSQCDSCDVSLYQFGSKTYQLITDYETNKSVINLINTSGGKDWGYSLPNGYTFDIGRTAPAADSHGNLYVTYKNEDWDSGKEGRYLASFDAQGKLKWEFKVDYPYGPTTPIIGEDGTVYFGSGNPTDYIGPMQESLFYAVSSTGQLKWSKKLRGDGGTWKSDIYFDAEKNIVYNTEGDPGSWKHTLSQTGDILNSKERSSYWYDKADNEYLTDDQSNRLIAKDKNGNQLWTYQGAVGDGYSSLSVEYIKDDGTVFLSDYEDNSLVSITNGKVNWKSDIQGLLNYHPKGLYFIDFVVDNEDTWEGHSVLKVVNEQDGKIKFTQSFDSEFYNMTILDDGSVLFPVGRDIHKVTLSNTVKTGWVQSDNKWYYYDANGVLKTGWFNVNGTWYYAGSDGVMKTGWVKDGSSWYYMKSSGAMAMGWLKEGTTWYYFKSSGAMATGWVKDAGTWYFFKSSGAMTTGWFNNNGTWYYFKSSGAMVTGWQKINSKWYYFASSGAWSK